MSRCIWLELGLGNQKSIQFTHEQRQKMSRKKTISGLSIMLKNGRLLVIHSLLPPPLIPFSQNLTLATLKAPQ